MGVLITLATFTLSGLTYIATTVGAHIQELRWTDRVIPIEAGGTGVNLLNTGDGDVFLTQVDVECSALGYAQTILVNRVLKKGEFLPVDTKAVKGDVVIGLSDVEWSKIVAAVKERGREAGYAPVFLIPDHPALERLRRIHSPLNGLKGMGRLRYISARQRKDIAVTSYSFELVVLLATYNPSSQPNSSIQPTR